MFHYPIALSVEQRLVSPCFPFEVPFVRHLALPWSHHSDRKTAQGADLETVLQSELLGLSICQINKLIFKKYPASSHQGWTIRTLQIQNSQYSQSSFLKRGGNVGIWVVSQTIGVCYFWDQKKERGTHCIQTLASAALDFLIKICFSPFQPHPSHAPSQSAQRYSISFLLSFPEQNGMLVSVGSITFGSVLPSKELILTKSS